MKRVPGQRIAGETDLAWQYFQIYRDMGESRSLGDLCGISVDGKKRTLNVFGRWSSVHNWVERISEWDSHNTREVARQAARERQADIKALVKGRLEIGKVEEALYRRLLRQFAEGELNTLQWRQASLAYNTSWEVMKELIGFMDDETEKEFNGYVKG